MLSYSAFIQMAVQNHRPSKQPVPLAYVLDEDSTRINDVFLDSYHLSGQLVCHLGVCIIQIHAAHERDSVLHIGPFEYGRLIGFDIRPQDGRPFDEISSFAAIAYVVVTVQTHVMDSGFFASQEPVSGVLVAWILINIQDFQAEGLQRGVYSP